MPVFIFKDFNVGKEVDLCVEIIDLVFITAFSPFRRNKDANRWQL